MPGTWRFRENGPTTHDAKLRRRALALREDTWRGEHGIVWPKRRGGGVEGTTQIVVCVQKVKQCVKVSCTVDCLQLSRKMCGFPRAQDKMNVPFATHPTAPGAACPERSLSADAAGMLFMDPKGPLTQLRIPGGFVQVDPSWVRITIDHYLDRV